MLPIEQYPDKLETHEDYEFIRKNFPPKYFMSDFRTLIIESIEPKILWICDVSLMPYRKTEGEQKYRIDKKHDPYKDPKLDRYYELIADDCDEKLFAYDDHTNMQVGEYLTKLTDPDNGESYFVIMKYEEKENSRLAKAGYSMDNAIAISLNAYDETAKHIDATDITQSQAYQDLQSMMKSSLESFKETLQNITENTTDETVSNEEKDHD